MKINKMKPIIIVITVFLLLPCTIFAQSEEMEIKIFTIKYGDADSMYSVVNHLKSSEGKMTVDLNTNSLIVIDYPANLKQIARVISKLDAQPDQIEIKVVITDVTDTFLNEIGMSSSQIIIPSGEFSTILSLIKSSKDSNIRSEMSVRTLNNQPANIQATVEDIFGYGTNELSKTRKTVAALHLTC